MKNKGLTVEEAAQIAGRKEPAIRMGIKRDVIVAEKDNEGTVWVKARPFYINLSNRLAKVEKEYKHLSKTVPELKKRL